VILITYWSTLVCLREMKIISDLGSWPHPLNSDLQRIGNLSGSKDQMSGAERWVGNIAAPLRLHALHANTRCTSKCSRYVLYLVQALETTQYQSTLFQTIYNDNSCTSNTKPIRYLNCWKGNMFEGELCYKNLYIMQGFLVKIWKMSTSLESLPVATPQQVVAPRSMWIEN